MTIVICDDDGGMLQQMKACCLALPFKDLNCCTYENPLALLADIKAKTMRADAFILDIDMPGLSGIEIKNALAASGETSAVIFLTSHMEMMQEAFGRNVVAFLSKNNWRERLQRELERIYEDLNKCITIECAEKMITIPLKDILSINADDYYSRLRCFGRDGDGLLVKKALKAWEKELTGASMYRLSRHVIINMENIERYDGHSVTMVNGDIYSIPKGTIKKFREAYFAYMKKHERIL